MSSTIAVETNFECANADKVEVRGNEIRFSIRPDTESTDRQWFYFRVVGAKDTPLRFRMDGVSITNIPLHWKDARPVTSGDNGATFARIDGKCSVDEANNCFLFEDTPTSNAQLYAFHYPYGYTQNLTRVATWSTHQSVEVSVIGQSVEKRPIHRLVVTDGAPSKEKKGVWVTCRQHAAETVASFFLDGFMNWLLSKEPAAVALREAAVINVVPMLNPDGVIAGNYRDNILGVNLNRVWNAPAADSSPEILAVTGSVAQWVAEGNRYDFYTDLHGDSECLAFYAFHPAASIKPPKYKTPETYHADCVKFLQRIVDKNPEFTLREGATELEDPGISRQFMTTEYGVLGVLFENGYSYLDYGATKGEYITPERHMAIGRAYGEALAEHIAAL